MIVDSHITEQTNLRLRHGKDSTVSTNPMHGIDRETNASSHNKPIPKGYSNNPSILQIIKHPVQLIFMLEKISWLLSSLSVVNLGIVNCLHIASGTKSLRVTLTGKYNYFRVALLSPWLNFAFERNYHLIVQSIESFRVIKDYSAFVIDVLIDDFLAGEELLLDFHYFLHIIIIWWDCQRHSWLSWTKAAKRWGPLLRGLLRAQLW